jgi:hypothetical protein
MTTDPAGVVEVGMPRARQVVGDRRHGREGK